eukprot:TRINITY_DN4956_c0_g1_i1.p1 TRINITY_DN4956_c0_g1~~TRINITY_DN4956_c0_g1_i1.p1  ORF type:complete len:274 (-),score=27.68 TRINITY_DN4956_c0_g1_i1:227-1048(-)
MGIPELVIDFRRLSLVDSTIESLCRLLLHVVVTLRFVWLGMFTNSCHAHEPRGDNISNAFATMSTVLFVVVVTLFPVHWMKLINTATQSSLNPVAAILIWTISFGSAIGYLGLGVVFTCLQYTNYYLHHQEHHPLYFERLLLVVGFLLLVTFWTFLILFAIYGRHVFSKSEKGKQLIYKSTGLISSVVVEIIFIVVCVVYFVVERDKDDPHVYLAVRTVIEVLLACFAFILWICLQRYFVVDSSFCVRYLKAWRGDHSSNGDVYYDAAALYAI